MAPQKGGPGSKQTAAGGNTNKQKPKQHTGNHRSNTGNRTGISKTPNTPSPAPGSAPASSGRPVVVPAIPLPYVRQGGRPPGPTTPGTAASGGQPVASLDAALIEQTNANGLKDKELIEERPANDSVKQASEQAAPTRMAVAGATPIANGTHGGRDEADGTEKPSRTRDADSRHWHKINTANDRMQAFTLASNVPHPPTPSSTSSSQAPPQAPSQSHIETPPNATSIASTTAADLDSATINFSRRESQPEHDYGNHPATSQVLPGPQSNHPPDEFFQNQVPTDFSYGRDRLQTYDKDRTVNGFEQQLNAQNTAGPNEHRSYGHHHHNASHGSAIVFGGFGMESNNTSPVPPNNGAHMAPPPPPPVVNGRSGNHALLHSDGSNGNQSSFPVSAGAATPFRPSFVQLHNTESQGPGIVPMSLPGPPTFDDRTSLHTLPPNMGRFHPPGAHARASQSLVNESRGRGQNGGSSYAPPPGFNGPLGQSNQQHVQRYHPAAHGHPAHMGPLHGHVGHANDAQRFPGPLGQFYGPAGAAEGLLGSIPYFQAQFDTPDLSDCLLELKVSHAQQDTVRINGHKMILARSPTLKQHILLARSRDPGSHIVSIESGDQHMRSDAWAVAIQRLYMFPLFTVPHPVPNIATASPDLERLRFCLGYTAAGHFLQMDDVRLRGLELASTMIDWNTIEEGLAFAFEGAVERHEAYDDATPAAVEFRYGRETSGFMASMANFLIQNIPEDFALDSSVSNPSKFSRIPMLPGDTSSGTASAMTSPTSSVHRGDPIVRSIHTNQHKSHDSRVSSIRFGDLPSTQADGEASIKSSGPLSSTAPTVLSRILLNLPFLDLCYVLTSQAMGAVGWNSGRARFDIIADVLNEREARRLRAVQSIREGIPHATQHIRQRLSASRRHALVEPWDVLCWREEVILPSATSGESLPRIVRHWVPQFEAQTELLRPMVGHYESHPAESMV